MISTWMVFVLQLCTGPRYKIIFHSFLWGVLLILPQIRLNRHYGLVVNDCLECSYINTLVWTWMDHYNDVIMTTIASQITSLTVVYSTHYSDANQRKHQSSASLAFVRGIHRDRWIPRTKGQLRGKCFHLITSSCVICRSQPQRDTIATTCTAQTMGLLPPRRTTADLIPKKPITFWGLGVINWTMPMNSATCHGVLLQVRLGHG